jgi:hypothetical protein
MALVASGVAVEFGQPPGATIGRGGAVFATAMAMAMQLKLAWLGILWQSAACAAEDSPIGRRPRAGWICPCAGRKRIASEFRHPKFAGSVILSGQSGDDAKHYQEKQVRNAIREVSK